MLFCHRAAELVRRAGDLSCRTNISGKDCQNGRDIAQRHISAPSETGSDKNGRVRDAIWNFVVELAGF